MANPVIFTAAGQSYPGACRINAVIWEGSTSIGDTATLNDIFTGAILWPGRTNDTNTYLGANFGYDGIPAPLGVSCGKLSSGKLYVYLRES